MEKKKETIEPEKKEEIKKCKKCPKCGFECDIVDEICPKCGIVYKKYEEKTKCPNRRCQAERNPKDERCQKCGIYYEEAKTEENSRTEDDNTNNKKFKLFVCTVILLISAVHPGAFWIVSWVVAALFISQKTKSKVTVLGGGFIASCFMFIIFANITGMEKVGDKKTPTITDMEKPTITEAPNMREMLDQDVHGAWAYMQMFVEERLKSPRSAQFPFGGYQHVTPLGNSRYKVQSYVDADNTFGAKIRTNFEGVIKKMVTGGN